MSMPMPDVIVNAPGGGGVIPVATLSNIVKKSSRRSIGKIVFCELRDDLINLRCKELKDLLFSFCRLSVASEDFGIGICFPFEASV